MDLIYSVLLILSVVVGAVLGLLFNKPEAATFKIILSFSGAYLFSVTVLHLLPEIFESAHHSHEEFSGFFIGICMLGGFFLQKLLEFFSSGIEHGHMHAHTHLSPFVILLSLAVHAFFEGTILSPNHAELVEHSHGGSLLVGILIHKAPAALVLFLLLRAKGLSNLKLVVLMTFFALSSPMGYFFAEYGLAKITTDFELWFIVLQAVVAGGFFHISTTLVFESNPEHSLNWKKLASIVAGVGLAIVVELM